MKRLHTTAVMGVLLLAVAACAHQQPAIGFGGQPPPPPPTPATPEPVDQRMPVPDSEVDFSKLPQGYPHTVWTQDGGTVVVVTVAQGGCGKDQAEAADQTGQQVTIAVISLAHKPGLCPMYLQYVPQAVRLAAPLNQRKIVLEPRAVSMPNGGPATG
jgi:hypothetical protein